jgi:AAHS family 4-hydroxybenzoate transporter-like MFS transporter
MFARKHTIAAIVDNSPLAARQLVIIGLCGLVMMVDGFDTQSIALVAPDIAAAWHIGPSIFGLVFGAGLFGGLIGAMIFGMAGDRKGRKPILMATVLLFAALTPLTPLAGNGEALIAVRFLTGLGLGGAMPIMTSIASEYAPARWRDTLVALMFCGFPLGGVVGGLVSARLIPAFGWQSVFYFGGALPLFLLPFIWRLIPESVMFLSLRGDRQRIAAILQRMRWLDAWDGELRAKPQKHRSSVISLFTEGRAFSTVLLWASLFMSLLITYFLINWIPLLARQSGVGAASAVYGVVALNIGVIAGCIGIGWLAGRSGRPILVIAGAFALGALATALIGRSGESSTMLYATAFLAGGLCTGAQICTIALGARIYETALRATGVGWAIGVGRVGSLVGPIAAGVLIGAGMPVPTLFVLVGALSFGSAAAVWLLGRAAAVPLARPILKPESLPA